MTATRPPALASVVALWCVDQFGQPTFVAAFPVDFVERCPDRYARAHRAAMDRHLAGLDYPAQRSAHFFATRTSVDVPPPPDMPPPVPAPPAACPAPSPLDNDLELVGSALA